MVLTSHAVFGAALASAGRLNPVSALAVGFVSHFLLDALPHWEYQLKSAHYDKLNPLNNDLVIGRNFLHDLLKISFDALLGLGLSWFFFSFGAGVKIEIVLAGAVGGILPDALSFLQMKFKHQPWVTLQRFHLFSHAQKNIKGPLLGISLQGLLITSSLFLGTWSFFSW